MSLPETGHELEGWALLWLGLALREPPAPAAALDAAVHEVETALKRLAAERPLSDVPRVMGIRRLFRRAGTDPTRYRPSSEALARRVLRGDPLPRICPAVDLNNLISIEALSPCCVLRPESLRPPFVLRRGAAEEAMASLRGPFNLEGKPLLADQLGPFGTPITDSERVSVDGSDREVWLVAYAAADDPRRTDLETIAERRCAETGVATITARAWSLD